MQELGLFCGTFNPIHLGHLLIAESARVDFALEKVLFVVSPEPPHRRLNLLSGEDRYTMVVAACQGNSFFVPSRLELDRPGPSYTVDTVRAVKDIYPGHRINLIIGGDNLATLNTWHEAEALVELARLLVVPRLKISAANKSETRDNKAEKLFEKDQDLIQSDLLKKADVNFVDFPGVAISASSIRKRIQENKSVLYMVPPAVAEIISTEGFYSK